TPTDANLGKCRGLSKTSGLKGDLGIKEIFETGLGYTTDRPVKTGQPPQDKYPYMMPAIDVTTYLTPSDPLNGGAALAPNFGSTVDFTLVYGLGGGPNWT